MDKIASTEFQKRYPRLDTPHQVTAHGRTLGVWFPTGTFDPAILDDKPPADGPSARQLVEPPGLTDEPSTDPPRGISNDPDRIFGVKVSSLEDIRNMTDAQHIANIAHLPKQDREYLERKLRQGKRT
jgi:hypothetical protein